MRTSIFFNSSWLGQLIVGCGLFACSFLIEYQILAHFITPPLLALALSITLEGGKVAAVIWHYYLGYLASEAYPLSVRFSSLVFRAGLFLLSLMCSMLFLTARLDRPNLNQVRQQRLAAVMEQARNDAEHIRERFAEKRRLLQKRQQQQRMAMTNQHTARIKMLETMLRNEMNNVINGVFKGPRYREIERRLTLARQDFQQELDAQRQRHDQAAHALEQELDQTIMAIQNKADQRRQQIIENDYGSDRDVHDQRIMALLDTVDAIFHYRWHPLQFVFFFSILISLLMETGIMLAFSTITMAIAPVLHARHMEELEKESVRVRTRGAMEQETIRHQASMEQVSRAGRRILQQAGFMTDDEQTI